MQFEQVLSAVENQDYTSLQSHLYVGGGFVDGDGRLLEAAVLADDDVAIRLLLRGGCGLLGGDGKSVIRAAALGRGRALQLFRTHPDWNLLSMCAIDAAFRAALEGRRVECVDILLSTHRVSSGLIVSAFRQMVTVGSLVGSDVLGDYVLGRFTELEVFRSKFPDAQRTAPQLTRAAVRNAASSRNTLLGPQQRG